MCGTVSYVVRGQHCSSKVLSQSVDNLVDAIFFLSMVLSVDRSYGSVFKAMHKETGQVVAIKQVPVDTDLQEIIKEISMMQQCDRYMI